MDGIDVDMDNISTWLEKVLKWVDHRGVPRIPYIGKAPGGYGNKPAEHLEVVYLLDKGVDNVSIGGQVVSIPPFHLAIHSVHQGVFTPRWQRLDAWCLFLDVANEKAFAELCHTPLYCSAPLAWNREVIAAYERLGSLCVRYGTEPSVYQAPGATYDSGRVGAANPAATARIEGALLELFGLLLDLIDPKAEHPAHPLCVQQALEFLSLHYRDASIRLDDIARAAALEPHHFSRVFSRHLSTSPIRYLRDMRLQDARALLRDTTMLVEEVAFSVGFNDPLHFSRVFHTATGLSPTAWRAAKAAES